jgi:hypothetical protein
VTNVLIGADICPIEGNTPYFKSGDAATLFGDLLPEFASADLAIANLECPLIVQPTPIQKTGPVFGEETACINGIKIAGIDVLGLANNHIFDHGEFGLRSTLETCAAAGIDVVGAGPNLASAQKILVKQCGKLRIGILAVAEHEFSIAGKNSWGASPLDLIEIVRNINSRKAHFDYLIVLLHGGDEFMVPSPRIQKTCRFIVESGADAVIVQHPHCIGGYEEYCGAHIVYGQGALLMDEAIYRARESFHEGFLIKLAISDDADATMSLIPFRQSCPAPGIRQMSGPEANEFSKRLEQRSLILRDDAAVENEWVRFCDENKHAYLSALLGHNGIIRRLNARGGLAKLLYPKRVRLTTRNIVRCETHKEAIDTIFDHGLI